MIKSTILKLKQFQGNFALKDCDVEANLTELRNDVTFVPINKAANKVGILCKRLYILVIAKELRFNSANSNDKNGAHKKNEFNYGK